MQQHIFLLKYRRAELYLAGTEGRLLNWGTAAPIPPGPPLEPPLHLGGPNDTLRQWISR